MAGRRKKGEKFEGGGCGDREEGQKHLPRPCADATSVHAKARAKAPRLILWERASGKARESDAYKHSRLQRGTARRRARGDVCLKNGGRVISHGVCDSLLSWTRRGRATIRISRARANRPEIFRTQWLEGDPHLPRTQRCDARNDSGGVATGLRSAENHAPRRPMNP